MKLFYYRDPEGNFGDDLNDWLWPRLLPGAFDQGEDGVLFLGIGTLLNDRLPEEILQYRVFGSGAGYGALPKIDARWRFHCVRGPRTAKVLGLDPALAVTDPGALVRTLDLPREPKRYRISFMPHHVEARRSLWKVCCQVLGIHYIDPRGSVETVLAEIQASELVAAGAMHGAIIADALRVPWVPVRFYEHILEFKWQDWCESLDLEYQPIALPRLPRVGVDWRSKLEAKSLPLRLLPSFRRVLTSRDPVLSSDAAIDRVTDRLCTLLQEVRKERASYVPSR